MNKVLKKNGKKIVSICIGILLFMAVVICCFYFGEEQIQSAMKKQMCANVMKYEEELLEIVKECPSDGVLFYYKDDKEDDEYYKTIYYKDLKDENVNRIFKKFRLIIIDKNEDNSVEFTVRSTMINTLWDYYQYGFYYTENDEPIDAVWGKDIEENEFEAMFDIGKYWYRTEKITDHWWYYESKILWLYPPAHRF